MKMSKWLKIPEMGIEIEQKVHDKGKTFSEIKIPKGLRLPKPHELPEIFKNKKYRDVLLKANDNDFWIFVEGYEWLDKDYVVRFRAGSVRLGLSCYGDPRDSYPALGVVFVRKGK